MTAVLSRPTPTEFVTPSLGELIDELVTTWRSDVIHDEPTFGHRPVMLDTVVALMSELPTGLLVDATLGGAGHSSALLAANPGRHLLGIDRDPQALAAATARLRRHGGRVELVQARSDSLLDLVGGRPVAGVLLDLGVSSPQIDDPGRGFSYRHEGPLDMRMGPEGPTASELIDRLDVAELARILRTYGDEPRAMPIARALVAARPVRTTAELASIVRRVVPGGQRRGDPAKRTFQALRIAVNDELAVLERTMDQALDALAPGGRLVVMSYHSGEDRIVKRRLREWADPDRGRSRHLPPSGQAPLVRLVERGSLSATPDEIEANPRAASVRLRVAERTDATREQR